MNYQNFQYSEQLEKLVSMGFDRETSMTSLAHFKGDIEQVLKQLDPKPMPATQPEINFEEIIRETTTPSGLINVGNSIISQQHAISTHSYKYTT
jgi:hypothetical protein